MAKTTLYSKFSAKEKSSLRDAVKAAALAQAKVWDVTFSIEQRLGVWLTTGELVQSLAAEANTPVEDTLPWKNITVDNYIKEHIQETE